MAPRRPTSTGRRKIEIQRIESEAARHVCFSKRRAGLFNKVSELSTLCGAEVAAVAFSPGDKAFTIGHPSVDLVLDRFRNSNYTEEQTAAVVDGSNGDRSQALEELNQELGELRAQLAAIKRRKKAALLDLDLSRMGEKDLEVFAAALAKVHGDAEARINQVLQEAQLFGRPVHGGGGGMFEFGGTSASGGMEMTQQQLLQQETMPMGPPTGFHAGMEMAQLQHMMMAMPPPPTGFTAGTEMMKQQQQMMMMMAMPPPTGFAAGTEMMMQQQQMMMMAMAPLPTEFNTGMETQQQQMMLAMPLPPLPGFAPGMEMVYQGFY